MPTFLVRRSGGEKPKLWRSTVQPHKEFKTSDQSNENTLSKYSCGCANQYNTRLGDRPLHS